MVIPEVRDKIIEDLEQLPPNLQHRALELVHGLTLKPRLPRGASKEDLRKLAGTLDDESAREMRDANEESCEIVNTRAVVC